MTEQSLDTLPAIFSLSDSSVMAGASNKSHKGQTEIGEQSFLRVLANSGEDREGVLNQSLVPVGPEQYLGPLTGVSELSFGVYENRNSFIMDAKQVLAGMECDSAEKEALIDDSINHTPSSEALSIPITDNSLLHLLVSVKSQDPNTDIDSGRASNDLATRAAETRNNNPVIVSSAGIPTEQSQGLGVLSDPHVAGNVDGEEPLPLPSADNTNPNQNPPLPQISQQGGVEEWETDFVLKGIEESERETNQNNRTMQGLDIEKTVQSADTVTKSERVVQDKRQPSLELFNTGAEKMEVSLNSEEGAKGKLLGQSLLRSAHTVSSVGESAGEKVKESSHTLTVSKSDQSLDVASSTVNSNMKTLEEGTLATQTTEEGSVIAGPQGTSPREETNQNLTYRKQDLESRISSLNTAKEIRVNTTPESLSTEMTDHIAQRARLFLQGGKSEVKIQLNPPELGNLKLEFAVVDDVLETKISVEKSMIRDIIEKDIPRLRELISSADIDIGRFDVTLQEKEGSKQEFMNKGFPSDTRGKDDGNLANGGREDNDEEGDDGVPEQNSVISSRINYLI